MKRIAIYTRYSTDKQSQTSTEDQVRRCIELARRYQLNDDHINIYSDEALSGSGKDESKRLEFKKLIEDWDSGKIDILLVDEWSRLTREGVEHAKIVKRLEDNKRVRLITGNGLDTNVDNWQLVAALFGMVGQQSTRDTQYRVSRGMLGQLERGFMIAAPTFGYDLKVLHDDNGRSHGTQWFLNEERANVVREIFSRRANGQSMHQIARWLNQSNIPTSRKSRKNGGGIWRPARVSQILKNTIYRGIFEWHGSKNYQNTAKAKGIDLNILTFKRPELRIVSDEIWNACNGINGVSRSGYGGGKHQISGLFTCGYCHGILAISGRSKTPSLCCPSCSIAKSTAGDTNRLTSTVATAGAVHLLKEALKYFLTPAFVSDFKESLRLKLNGDTHYEIAEAETNLTRLKRQQEKLSRLIATSDEDDTILLSRYAEARNASRRAEERLYELSESCKTIDVNAIQEQLNVDPSEMLEDLFEAAEVPPEKTRALLNRLFPKIVFEGKTGRYTSIFSITFATGVALSEISRTGVVDQSCRELRFELRFSPNFKCKDKNLPRWFVNNISESNIPIVGTGKPPVMNDKKELKPTRAKTNHQTCRLSHEYNSAITAIG